MSYLISAQCVRLRCPGVAKAVLMQLADIANDAGHAWPSIETLCIRTDWGRTAVINALAWLEEHGAVRADRRNGRQTVYWVTPQAFTGPRHPDPEPLNPPASRAQPGLFGSPRAGANPSARRTGPPDVPVREADGTRPPGVPDPSARRTLITKNHQEPDKTPQPPADSAVGAPGGARAPGGDGDAAVGFDAVAAVYPKRAKVEAARRVWVELAPSTQLQAEILRAVRAWSRSDEWMRDGGRYVPKLSSFLRDRRWLDAPGAGAPAPLPPPPVQAPRMTPEELAINKQRADALRKQVQQQRRGASAPVTSKEVECTS